MLIRTALTFCEYASSIRKGGYPKKKKLSRHLFVNHTRSLLEHIHKIAPHPLVPFSNDMPKVFDHLIWKNAECPLCLNLLNNPIELVTRGSILCSQC